jgi:hypothetical protein
LFLGRYTLPTDKKVEPDLKESNQAQMQAGMFT